MKIIITEEQLNYLVENINPCPEGKKEDKLVTLDDLKKGGIINKGYCNSKSDSAIVKIQKMLQDKGLLDRSSYPGYYGDKTREAIKKLFDDKVNGEKIGPKTLAKLEKPKTTETPTKKSGIVSKGEAEKIFNKLSYDQKVLVCTLLGEAGGEKNPKRDMTAIANVLKNRAKKGHMKKTTMVAQALIPYQFSMWNNKSVESVFDKFKDHGQMLTAIDIIQNINSIPDITNGALYYYANYISPNWAKNTDTTIWKETAEIGKHIFGNVLPKRKKKK
jgi:spore germination cell wall hydrolase CwlJ-like protein